MAKMTTQQFIQNIRDLIAKDDLTTAIAGLKELLVSLITKSVPPICTKSVPLYQNYAMLLKWVKKSLMR